MTPLETIFHHLRKGETRLFIALGCGAYILVACAAAVLGGMQ